MKLGILMTCTDMIFSNLGSPGMALKEMGSGSTAFTNTSEITYSKGVFLFKAGDFSQVITPFERT